MPQVNNAKLAVVQMAMSTDLDANVAVATEHIRNAAAAGANIVLVPELFENHYFPQYEREDLFRLAHEVEGHPFITHFATLAKELGVVLPISFFEKANHAYFNSLAMIDADGTVMGVYRKSHIPDGPGYEEKYYFNPGDTGFKTWSTKFGKIGVGICWDQWYPEAARVMSLYGADLLLYPTAIGSEPPETGGYDTGPLWHRVMIGHAVANLVYVAAANRVGVEGETEFYGTSFIAEYSGEFMELMDKTEEGFVLSELDYETARDFRAGFGFFRDRRPDLYGPLLTLDGREK